MKLLSIKDLSNVLELKLHNMKKFGIYFFNIWFKHDLLNIALKYGCSIKYRAPKEMNEWQILDAYVIILHVNKRIWCVYDIFKYDNIHDYYSHKIPFRVH